MSAPSDEVLKPGDILHQGAYKVNRKLGDGGTAIVFEAEALGKGKLEKGKIVAIKMNRSNGDKICGNEKTVIDKLYKLDGEKSNHHIVRLLDSFGTTDFPGHFFLVLQIFPMSLHQFIMNVNQSRPLPPHQAQDIASQIMHGLAFMHAHDLTNTDVTSANIMLVNDQTKEILHRDSTTEHRLLSTSIRFIDLGSATFEKDQDYYITAMPNRSPEVSLGMKWWKNTDIFSAACVFYELRRGKALFRLNFIPPGLADLEHLAKMQKVLGPLPDDFIGKALEEGIMADSLFKAEQKPPTKPGGETTEHYVLAWPRRMRRTTQQMKDEINKTPSLDSTLADMHEAGDKEWGTLLKKMLSYYRDRRPSAANALRDPYFQLRIADDNQGAH